MNTHYMQSLDWIILAIYFVILLAIGIWASSKRKKEGSYFSQSTPCVGTISVSPCGAPMLVRRC